MCIRDRTRQAEEPKTNDFGEMAGVVKRRQKLELDKRSTGGPRGLDQRVRWMIRWNDKFHITCNNTTNQKKIKHHMNIIK